MGQKINKAVVYRECSNAVNAGQVNGRMFYVVEPERGKRQVLEEMPDSTVRFVDPQTVVNEMMLYSCNVDRGYAYEMTPNDAKECVKYWLGITTPIGMPIYLGEKDDPRLCFHRLDFNYDDIPKETPVIDEFLGRCSNNEAIRLFIGSIFVEDSSRYQYLWLYGAGGEGKGCFGRALARLIGPGATTMVVPKTDSQKQFLAYSLQGKRLCIFPECSNFSFPNDPLFKQFTGMDDVWIEQKGKQGHNAPINCKFIFFSNERAGVAGTDANSRRLIYSEIGKPAVRYSTRVYDGLLASEMSDFVLRCRNEYIAKCPLGEDVPFDDEITKQLFDFNEERFEVLTEQCLEVGESFMASSTEMQRLKANAGMSQTEYRNFIEYLRRKVGLCSRVVWDKDVNKAVKRWCGIRFLTSESGKIT